MHLAGPALGVEQQPRAPGLEQQLPAPAARDQRGTVPGHHADARPGARRRSRAAPTPARTRRTESARRRRSPRCTRSRSGPPPPLPPPPGPPPHVSDKDAADSYRRDNTKIKFDYAVINAEDLRKQINPTDAELQAFFKQSAARYKDAIPETRKLTYIALNQTAVPGGTPAVPDQQVLQYYQGHQKDYQVPEGVTVRHILIKVDAGADPKIDAAAKQKAEALLKQIKGGADFAALAKANSDDPGSKEQGGELGMIQRGVTVPPFEKAAFALEAGQISDVIKTQFGYHIIKVEAKQAAHLKSLDEVKAQILATLIRQAEADQQASFAQQIAAEAAKSGLAKTAEAHHLQLVTTDYVPQNAVLPGLPDGAKMLTMAFSGKPGAAPQVSSTGEGFAVFQVADSKAAHAPTFEEYKTHLADDFREQQLPQLLARKTNALANEVKQTGNLNAAAKSVGATVKTSDFVGRDGQVPDLGQLGQIAPQVFNLADGQVYHPINTGRNGIVVKLTGKQEPQPAGHREEPTLRPRTDGQPAPRGALRRLRHQHHATVRKVRPRPHEQKDATAAAADPRLVAVACCRILI